MAVTEFLLFSIELLPSLCIPLIKFWLGFKKNIKFGTEAAIKQKNTPSSINFIRRLLKPLSRRRAEIEFQQINIRAHCSDCEFDLMTSMLDCAMKRVILFLLVGETFHK